MVSKLFSENSAVCELMCKNMVDLERTHEIKLNSGLPWQKQHSRRRRRRIFSPAIWTSEKLVKVLLLEHSFVWGWNSNTSKVGQKYLDSSEMCCWRRMEKISWTDRVTDEMLRSQGKRNILHAVKRRKANWIDLMLSRNCLIKHVIEGKIEGIIQVTGRWGRRRKQLLDDLKETRGYWNLKEENSLRKRQRTPHNTDCVMTEEPDRPPDENITRRRNMRCACLITKAIMQTRN